jgi:hypothetical protein
MKGKLMDRAGKMAITLLAVWATFAGRAHAQYTMDELSVNAGAGYALFPNLASAASGPAAHANFVYGHYLCGKAYGFQLEGGIAAFLPSHPEASNLFGSLPAERLSITSLNLALGAYAKIRPRDYHRPREIALLVGPKVLLPLVGRYSAGDQSGALRDVAATVSTISLGGHLGLQIRRPAKEKKSWFIEPGVDYYFMPLFNGNPAGDVRNLYLSLGFGFAFWDKRG